MFIKRIPFTLALLIALGSAVSCVKSIPSSGSETETETANPFNFATTRACPINVDYGLNNYMILVEVYDQNPILVLDEGDIVKNPTLTPIYKAITSAEGKISETMELPLAVKTVFLYTDYFGVPSTIPVSVTDSGINFTLSGTATAQTKANPIYPYPEGVFILGGWDHLGVPDYLLPTRTTHPLNLLYDLHNALPATYIGNKETSIINTYLAEKTELNLHLVKPTKLTMVFAHEAATKFNSIGYFHYPTDTPPTSADEIQKILAFPNFSIVNYSTESVITGGNLSSGDQIALQYWDGTQFTDEFPANTSVGFLLFDSAFKNGEIGKNRNIYYSITEFNTMEPEEYRQHCIAFESKSRNLVAYTFEDAIRNKSANEFYTGGNFRDNMFYIKPSANAPFATGNMIQLPESENPEPQPDDNTLTYSGILAFEDVWPYMGDYDMNDVVIEYHTTHYRNTQNQVLRAVDEITFKHNGGAFTSGFGYQFSNLRSNQIQQVRISPGLLTSSSILKTDEKGLEASNEATVVVFDNSQTVPVGTTFTIETLFRTPQPDRAVTPPYNPFLVIHGDKIRGHELHLPHHRPTQLMDKTLLGTGHDKSDPDKGIYYASSAKYPFAIKIPNTSFIIPDERENIGVRYPQFIEWVDSNGATNQDWYLHPKK